MNRLRPVWGLLFGLLLGTSALANTVPQAVRDTLYVAQLSGSGSYRVFGIKLYDARLWRIAAHQGDIFEQPFVLELTYARSLSGQRIAESSLSEMRRLGFNDSALEASWLDWMARHFPDVEEGTRLAGAYLPARGLRLYRDDRLWAELDDQLFARAFFAIWLDPRTRAPALRRSLLGTLP